MGDRATERVRENIRSVADGLDVPLHVEFPGYHHKFSPFDAARRDAYEHFSSCVRDTGAFATIDVGHLLSYRWLRGHRDEALYENLNELPLEIVRELHLSGCSIVRGTFMDLHHGSLLDEQLHLTRLLLDATPTIRFVTYEDPKFDAAGAFVRTSRTSNDALRDVVRTETNAGVA